MVKWLKIKFRNFVKRPLEDPACFILFMATPEDVLVVYVVFCLLFQNLHDLRGEGGGRNMKTPQNGFFDTFLLS